MTYTELRRALVAIAEGYPIRCDKDRYIVVENPSFQEDDGSDPFLVIDVRKLPEVP